MKAGVESGLAAVRQIFSLEMSKASHAENSGSQKEVWFHLERAHIVSQPVPRFHFLVHWKMLRYSIISRNWREMLAQVPRLLLAAPSSWMKTAPRGNPGSSRMSMFAKAEIPDDLKSLL